MSQIIGGHTFVPLERNIDDVKLNSITSGATITSELISTQTLSTSAVTNDQFLILKAAGTLARILYDDLATSLASATGMVNAITSVRLRSFNAMGNPNFEVNQVQGTYNLLTNPANGTKLLDRWLVAKSAVTAAVNAGQAGVANTLLPSTNFCVSSANLQLRLTTPQATLAAGDYYLLQQSIEGPMLRELINDVHSISLLAYSDVANLKFGVILRDAGNTKTISKLCTIPSAGTWTLITLPNIPVWPGGATWSVNAGNVGYVLYISLACGSTSMTPANDTWQNGNFAGAVGQSNWLASPANSNLYFAFIQHEPGPLSTTLIDKSFGENLDGSMGCLRYYCKSYDYAVKAGSVSSAGCCAATTLASQNVWGPFRFIRPMAKSPTVAAYSDVTGAAGGVRDTVAAGDRTVNTYFNVGNSGFAGCGLSTVNAAQSIYTFQYIADTGW